jgi:ribosomal protein S1
MAKWQPGEYSPPLVVEKLADPDSRRWRYGLAAQDVVDAAGLRFKVGENATGVVTGLRTRYDTGEITAVEVETAPGRRGLVPLYLWMWGPFAASKVPIGDQVELEAVDIQPEAGRFVFRRKPRFSKGTRLLVDITKVEDTYAIVDLDEAGSGLVPGNELSWEWYRTPGDVVKIGERREARIIDVDDDLNKIVLTFRLPELDWLTKIREDDEIGGVVVDIQDHGVVVAMETGGRGWVHLSEITWTYLDHPGEAVREGERVRVKVKRLDSDRRHVDLSIKAMRSRPMPSVGQIVTGQISSLTDYGAFVDLSEYGRGLVHKSEISWAFVKDPGDYLQLGEKVSAKVIGLDPINLSIKQLRPRPRLQVGQLLNGVVANVVDYGAFIDLAEYGSGLVHVSEISWDYVSNPRDELSEGDGVRVLVLQVVPKVALSIKQAQ